MLLVITTVHIGRCEDNYRDNTGHIWNIYGVHGGSYVIKFSVAYCSRSVVFSGIMISFVNVTDYYDITEISHLQTLLSDISVISCIFKLFLAIFQLYRVSSNSS
jgi:putative copper export protein